MSTSRSFHAAFPAEALPHLVRSYAESHNSTHASEVAVPAMTALTFLSSAMTKRFYFLEDGGIRVPPALWTILIAPASWGKSPIFRSFPPIFQSWHQQLSVDYATHKTKIADLRKQAARSKDAEEKGRLYEQASELARLIGEQDPIGMVVSRTTFTAAVRSMVSSHGIMLGTDEANALFNRLEWDRKPRSSSAMNHGWDGTPFSDVTVGSGGAGSLNMTQGTAACSMWLAGHDSYMTKFLRSTSELGIDVRATILNIAKGDFEHVAVNEFQAVSNYETSTEPLQALIAYLLRMFRVVDNKPRRVLFTESAIKVFSVSRESVSKMVSLPDSYASKYGTKLRKMAVVLAVCEAVEAVAPKRLDDVPLKTDHPDGEIVITEDVARRSVAIMEWCAQADQQSYATIQYDDHSDVMRACVKALARKIDLAGADKQAIMDTSIPPSYVGQVMYPKIRTVEARSLMNELIETGLLELRKPPKRKGTLHLTEAGYEQLSHIDAEFGDAGARPFLRVVH